MNAQDKALWVALQPTGPIGHGSHEELRARLTHLDKLERETIPALQKDIARCKDTVRGLLENDSAASLSFLELSDRAARVVSERDRLALTCADLTRSRDKLERALAWRENQHYVGYRPTRWEYISSGVLRDEEPHDGTPAGRAAALVRLYERVTGGV